MPLADLISVALPATDEVPYQTGDARVWVKPERDDLFGFLGCFGAGGFSWPRPDVTPVHCPDPAHPRRFRQIDEVVGLPSMPETSILGRSSAIHFLHELMNRECPLQVDIRYTRCLRPDDPDGWETIRRYCDGRITDYSGDDQVVINESGEVMETIALTAKTMYILRRIMPNEIDSGIPAALTVVKACDEPNCGECDQIPSDGCRRWVAGTEALGPTPYVGISYNGGAIWTWNPVAPWALGEAVSDIACIGGRIVVITADRGALCYSDDDGATWTEVTAGFLPGGDGRAIFALDARHVWIVGEAGAIYFTDDVTAGVTVQEDGLLTNQNLNKIVFVKSQEGYCVGDNNTFLYTDNGGNTWMLGLCAAGAVDLTALAAVHSNYQSMVIIGTSTGTVWQSYDGGGTWTQRVLPGVGTFNIPAIVHCGCAGLEFFLIRESGTYLAPTGGTLYHSIDGGITWPEIELPANLGVEDVSCCSPNYAIVVGSITAAGDGFLAVVR